MVLHPLEKDTWRVIRTHDLLHPGDHVLAAVSGGPDSLGMLHLLSALQKRGCFHLSAAYIDHQLRPAETPAEKTCVATNAANLQVPFHWRQKDAAGWQQTTRSSPEQAAREVRYQALEEIRCQIGANLVAVGHTADEQVEGVLIRMLRGGSSKALAGMTLQNGRLIRPLLETAKKDILSYLREKNISWCSDSSNRDLSLLRNRVRHRLLPFLEQEFGQGVSRSLRKCSAILCLEDDFLSQQAEMAWQEVIRKEMVHPAGCTLLRSRFRQLHPAIQHRVMEKLLYHLDCRASHTAILTLSRTACNGQPGGELHLSQGLRVKIAKATLHFSYPCGKGPWRGRLEHKPS